MYEGEEKNLWRHGKGHLKTIDYNLEGSFKDDLPDGYC